MERDFIERTLKRQTERLDHERVPERHLRVEVSDFLVPAPGQNGTLPRNAFRGPGFAEVSLSLSKKFMVSTSTSAEFRLDAFNALNRVNLGDRSWI